jgi:hypothetical protein
MAEANVPPKAEAEAGGGAVAKYFRYLYSVHITTRLFANLTPPCDLLAIVNLLYHSHIYDWVCKSHLGCSDIIFSLGLWFVYKKTQYLPKMGMRCVPL